MVISRAPTRLTVFFPRLIGARRTSHIIPAMNMTDPKQPAPADADAEEADAATPSTTETKVEEIGGPKGPDPTRFGDWSVNGRCFDF